MNQHPYLRPTDTGEWLKRLLWYEFELARMTIGWVPAIADYERKTTIGRFGYVHSMNVKLLQERIKELPVALHERSGTPAAVRDRFETISLCENDVCFLSSYRYALQQVYSDYDMLLSRLDPILDAPTKDQLKKVLIERGTITEYINHELQMALNDPEQYRRAEQWKSFVSLIWTSEPDVWPKHPVYKPAGPSPEQSVLEPKFRTAGPEYAGRVYTSPENSPLTHSVRQMAYINATEIVAAESLCYLFYSAHQMPIEFYCDLARHLWDEIRHSQMGIRRLLQMGYQIEQFRFYPPVRIQKENALEDFVEGYVALTQVAEACSFTMKRSAADAFWSFQDPLSAVQSEFDIVDERLHVEFGTKWGPELHKSVYKEVVTAKELAERARSKRLSQIKLDKGAESQLIQNMSQFCGVASMQLNYGNY